MRGDDDAGRRTQPRPFTGEMSRHGQLTKCSKNLPLDSTTLRLYIICIIRRTGNLISERLICCPFAWKTGTKVAEDQGELVEIDLSP